MKKPTQHDVAQLAGVSRTTVSFIVNGKDTQGVPISEETRQRVLDAVDELGYVVNARAQSLRSGDTKTIGVLLPIYENPFFWQLLSGIAAEAEASGYRLLLAHSFFTKEQEVKSITELAEQRVDGMIILTEFQSLPDEVMDQLRKSTYPIIEGSSSSAAEFDLIHQDYSEGTRALMTYLLEQGHRRIAYLHGVHKPEQGLDRLYAYRQILGEYDIPVDERFVYRCGPTMDDGYEATQALLKLDNPPTAIMAVNDLLGMAAISGAIDLGLRVPDDVSIAGFDGIPFARFVVPKLTTIASNPEENGRKAVQLLLKRLKEPNRPHEVIPTKWELIVRGSTGPAPS